MLTPCLAYILWRIYKVRSKLRGFKPVVQMFNDKKFEAPNISTVMTNRLHALETRLTSLLSSITTPGTELALPSTSCGPEPPPRKNSLPMVELNVIPADGVRNCEGYGHRELQNQTLQEVLAESCHRH